MRTWRRLKETLGVFPQYAKRHKSVYISVNNNMNYKKILGSFYLHKMGWIKAKKTSQATVPLME
jgi:hypothetical protein